MTSTSKCKTYKYSSDDENDLKVHMNANHSADYLKASETFGLPFECDICNLVFATDIKLKKHMCRITVKNPSFCDLYIINSATAGYTAGRARVRQGK